MNTENLQDLKIKLFNFLKNGKCEGYANYFYLDRNGLLHTGIGCNLEVSAPDQILVRDTYVKLSKPVKHSPSPTEFHHANPYSGDAYRYQWRRKNKTSFQDSSEMKTAIWRAIWWIRKMGFYELNIETAQPKDYNTDKNLLLPDDQIKNLFFEKLNERIIELKNIFPSFDNYPGDARLAMLVHAWAFYPKKRKDKKIFFGNKMWPNYTEACQKQNWWGTTKDSKKPKKFTAAFECHWTSTTKDGKKIPMSEFRYQHMVQMFRYAQEVKDNKSDRDIVHWDF